MTKNKMSKAEISVKFAELSDEAEKANGRAKGRRFLPMSQYRSGKLHDFGLYDYTTKRYTLCNIHSGQAPKVLAEMKKMLE